VYIAWCIIFKYVDAMRVGVKEFKKAYKKVDIDQVEVITT
jgi:hypothetical protein